MAASAKNKRVAALEDNRRRQAGAAFQKGGRNEGDGFCYKNIICEDDKDREQTQKA